MKVIITPDNKTVCVTDKGEIEVANFVASIVREQRRIDGRSITRMYEIVGEQGDTLLDPVIVSAEDFASMAWVPREWGCRCIIWSKPGAKDLLRMAIQATSDPDVEDIYTSTGWEKINNEWLFLTAEGAIGPRGLDRSINVDLPVDLQCIDLPQPAKASKIKEVIEIPQLLGQEIGWLILAAAFRAPWGADFAIHITGRTGTFKSEVAAIAQSFFGETSARNLPLSWSSTANAIEALCYRARDVLAVCDDFIPAGTSYQQRSYQTTADRIVRGLGNQAGRARLTEMSSHQKTMYPRCILLSTGEDTPEGHSVRGRMLITEISPGDVSAERLTRAQSLKPMLAEAMSAHLQWAARNRQKLKEGINETAKQARNQHLGIGHTRTPETLGKLISGAYALLSWASDTHQIEAQEANRLLDEAVFALRAIADRQHQYLHEADPADQFVQVLKSILAVPAGHLKSPQGGIPHHPDMLGWTSVGDTDWKHHGPRLGWANNQNDTIYLDPQVTYDTIRRHSRGSITLTRSTLYKRLREAGHLVEIDLTRQRNTVRVTLERASRQVLALSLSKFLKHESE